VRRDALDGGERLWMIANLTDAPLSVAMGRIDRGWKRHRWTELIGGWSGVAEELSAKLLLAPYQVVWLTLVISAMTARLLAGAECLQMSQVSSV
jgi:hypothetical protein